MISLFRTNQIIANVLLLFYAFLIRFPFFINRPSFSEEINGGIGWEYLSGFSWTEQGLTSALLAALLIVLQGFLINIIEFKFKLTDELFVLVKGFSASLRAVAWACLVLTITVYIMGVVMTVRIGHPAADMGLTDLVGKYGTVPTSMYSLLRLATMENWNAELLLSAKHGFWIETLALMATIVFANLGLLNLVIGIMCQLGLL